jgi:hypothetical protein
MMMQDPLWEDPNHIPLTNGPFAQTTPPELPSAKLDEDGQLLEFLVPFPMHILDEKPWPHLEVTINGRSVFLHKPLPVSDRLAASGRLGNESPDIYSCILRVSCAPDAQRPAYPTPAECWSQLDSLMTWIRVKARHYWVLHGQKGFGGIFRGPAFSQTSTQVGYRNFSSYGQIAIVQPLDESLWLTMKEELSKQAPVAESLFCDALLSAVAGDQIKAVLELGVAAEVEISQLLQEAAQQPPDAPAKRKYSSNGDWDKFKKKLAAWPQKLGMEEVTSFSMPGLFPEWVDVVRELYDLRGSVAHSGKLRPGVAARHIGEYLFSVNALLQYSRAQRTRLGLPVYSFPASRRPYDQIVGFRDGIFSVETSTSTASFVK